MKQHSQKNILRQTSRYLAWIILVQHCANNSEYSTCYLHQYCVVVSQQCHRIASFLRLALSQISGTVFHCYLGNAVLVCALLHLKPDRVQSIEVLNPYEPGEDILDKNFILDVKISLNNKTVVNIELQVQPQKYWNNRSLTYLCRLFDNLKKGASYSDVMPAYHIGILDFTLFPKHPEFYATYKMKNVRKHYIYNSKFTLNVLNLKQIKLATNGDKLWKLDFWARLFKATTWEEKSLEVIKNVSSTGQCFSGNLRDGIPTQSGQKGALLVSSPRGSRTHRTHHQTGL